MGNREEIAIFAHRKVYKDRNYISTYRVKYNFNKIQKMKKIEVALRELKEKIVTREDIDRIAIKYNFNTLGFRKLLLNKKYLITIFNGIYYLRNYDERKFNKIGMSSYELLSIGLKIKKIKWYFGLNSSIKFLNLTHEVFPINIVINDKFNRIKPLNLAGSKFLFIKIKPNLFFGIKNRKTSNNIFLYFSDLEKTLLDFLYLKKNISFSEYRVNKKKIIKYAKLYNSKILIKAKNKLENG